MYNSLSREALIIGTLVVAYQMDFFTNRDLGFKKNAIVSFFVPGCLGLYGLISFATIQRTKEVSIRKVPGAPLGSIVYLFSKEFIWLILISFLVSAPLAYYAMHSWLQNFAYHIEISAGIFIVAIIASFVIAALTIASQTIKAARANPVKALKTD